jgi:hypothetical protein
VRVVHSDCHCPYSTRVSYAPLTTYYPASSLPWRTPYPLPLSHSSPVSRLCSVLVIRPSSAMTRRYGVGMGLVVEPHALLRLVIPGLRMPLVYAVLSSAILLHVGVHLTWFCCGQCSSSTRCHLTSSHPLTLCIHPTDHLPCATRQCAVMAC